jgi:hypothetical protein
MLLFAAMTESTRAVLALDCESVRPLVERIEWILNKPENLAEVGIRLEMHWNEYYTTIYMPKDRMITPPTYHRTGTQVTTDHRMSVSVIIRSPSSRHLNLRSRVHGVNGCDLAVLSPVRRFHISAAIKR